MAEAHGIWQGMRGDDHLGVTSITAFRRRRGDDFAEGVVDIGGRSNRISDATQNPTVGFACLGDGSEATEQGNGTVEKAEQLRLRNKAP